MSSRKSLCIMNKENKAEYSAKLPKDHNEESVDVMLDNDDQIGVYRDFKYTPTVNTSSSSSTSSPVGVTSLTGIKGSGGSVVGKGTPVIPEYSAQLSKDANEESVDDMLAKVDQIIEGVYRDLNYTPSVNTSSSRSHDKQFYATETLGIQQTWTKDCQLINTCSSGLAATTTSSSFLPTSPVGVTSLSGIRGSGGTVVGKGTPVISENSTQLSKDHNEESVDDMLAKVDQIIEGVYRDFNYTPSVNTSSSRSDDNRFYAPERLGVQRTPTEDCQLSNTCSSGLAAPTTTTSSRSFSTTSAVGVTSLSGLRGSGGGNVVGKGTPALSEYSAQLSKDHNEESVDDMLANVDKFIEGVYRDLNYTPTVNTPSSSSITSRVGVNSLSGIRRSGGCGVGKGRPVISPVKKRKMDKKTARINQICDNADHNLRSIDLFINRPSENHLKIKLTSSPSSSTSLIIVHNTSSPVILVSPSVVDVCGHKDFPRPLLSINYQQLNRQRLPYNDVDVGDSCCAGPSAARRRQNEPSTFTKTLDSSCSDIDKTSNTVTSSSATTTDDTDHTPFMCPVCMESCIQRQPTSTRCGHVFCKECIEQAIRVTHKCPMCNTKISKNETFRIYL